MTFPYALHFLLVSKYCHSYYVFSNWKIQWTYILCLVAGRGRYVDSPCQPYGNKSGCFSFSNWFHVILFTSSHTLSDSHPFRSVLLTAPSASLELFYIGWKLILQSVISVCVVIYHEWVRVWLSFCLPDTSFLPILFSYFLSGWWCCV